MILVGEMRDEETVHTALSAAETGHLVLSTLHTVDAPETVNRIIDFFPPHQQQQARAMIAGTLKGIVSQRLVRTADDTGRVACCEILMMTGRVHDMILDPKLTGQLPEVVAERLLRDADVRPAPSQAPAGRPHHLRRGDARGDLPARLQADGRGRGPDRVPEAADRAGARARLADGAGHDATRRLRRPGRRRRRRRRPSGFSPLRERGLRLALMQTTLGNFNETHRRMPSRFRTRSC